MTCRLDEADRARVQPGHQSADPGRCRSGPRARRPPMREIAVVARPDFTSFPPVRNFDAIIALDEVDARLRSGMSASARIELNRLDNVLWYRAPRSFRSRAARSPMSFRADRWTRAPSPSFDAAAMRSPLQSGLQEGDRIALRDPDERAQTMRRRALAIGLTLVVVAAVALAWVRVAPGAGARHPDDPRAARAGAGHRPRHRRSAREPCHAAVRSAAAGGSLTIIQLARVRHRA